MPSLECLLNCLEFQSCFGVSYTAESLHSSDRPLSTLLLDIRSYRARHLGILRDLTKCKTDKPILSSLANNPTLDTPSSDAIPTNNTPDISALGNSFNHNSKGPPAVDQKDYNSTQSQDVGLVDNLLEKNIQSTRQKLEKIDTIDALKSFVNGFQYCKLKNSAHNTVFSDGTWEADIMLIGEAPGEQEDLQGIPFCGKSGILLDEILKSINLFRDKNIYISNSVFWRPPGNRKPTPDEVAICKPILEKHIALFKPKLIIVCGGTSLEALLSKTGITKHAGLVLQYQNVYMPESVPAIPIFHPAFLLRNPGAKASMWDIMLRIQQWCKECNIILNI